MKRFSKKRSFGLLEVVFASAILILFLVGGILLLRGSLRNVVTGKHRIAALSLANQQLERVRSIRDALYFQGVFDPYTSFDAYYGTPTCYDSNNVVTSCAGDTWRNGGKKVYPETCYNENSAVVSCAGTWFYKVQVTITPLRLNEIMDKVEVKVTWNDYGTLKTTTENTWILGCPDVDYDVLEEGPVDAVNVIDHTGSMDRYWGTMGTSYEKKITTAKRVLTSFNTQMITFNGRNPGEGRVGLVGYPLISGSKYFGKIESYLTSTTAGINAINTIINNFSALGGTPIADSIRLANQVFAAQPNSTAYRAMILASDGIANMDLNGNWPDGTLCGTDSDHPYSTCPSVTQAIAQASEARRMFPDNPIHVFAVAIGNDFNTYVLQNIADAPQAPFFQTASDPAALDNLYNEIFALISRQRKVQVCPGHTISP